MFGLGKKEEVTAEIKETSGNVEIVPASEGNATAEPAEEKVELVIRPTEQPKPHVCDENCQHEPPPLTRREAKYLKRANYNPNDTKFNMAYVLRNKRTGQIVEIRAASSFHACNIIGWKPNRVSLLAQRDLSTEAKGEKEVKRVAETPETTASSNP